jgi:hypothetical protein
MTTLEIAENLRYHRGQRQCRIPLALPLHLPEVAFPVHPYTLGAWIGDGSTGGGSAKITNLTREGESVFPHLEDVGESLGNISQSSLATRTAHARTVHGLVTGLKELGLSDGQHTLQKRIPTQYLRGSYEQRLDLLQGLMDTDGTWAAGRERAVFGATTTQGLADDVFQLVASLGLRPRITAHIVKGFGLSKLGWYVEFATNGVVPFKLAKKLERMGSPTYHPQSAQRIVESVQFVGYQTTQCVQVDSPDSTYLCGEQWVPTHNSVGLGTVKWDAPALYQAYEDKEIDLDELWNRIKRPLTPHRKQVNLYMYFLGVSQAIVIYEWKPTQEVKEFHLTLDMGLVQPMLDGAEQLLKHLEDKEVPPRPEGARKSGMCKYCSFKTMCWEAEA